MSLSIDQKVALAKISNYMLKGMRRYVEERNFYDLTLQLPSLTNVTGSCEQVSNLFTTEYPGNRIAFLPQSLQLYLELFTPYLDNVFCLVPSFRKELEIDNRHLTSFPLFEIEHQGDLSLLILHVKGIIQYAAMEVALKCEKELQVFGRNCKDLSNLGFEEITYEEALKLLNSEFNFNLKFGDDLKSEHESKITEYFGKPVITKLYPREIKFFSMRDLPEDPRLVQSMDLLLPFAGESAGSATRETNIHKICEKLINSSMYKMLKELNGVKDSDFDWYLKEHCKNEASDVLSCFKYTPEFLVAKEPPLHSGAGIGCARVLQFILGLKDIRQTMIYPRNAELL